MNRRDFLKLHFGGALWFAGGAPGLFFPKISFAGAIPDIGVATGTAERATRAAVGLLGGMGQFVRPGNRVLIKPNMSFPSPPERASNTHPLVIRELAAMCKEAGAAKILVLDNPLGPEELCLEGSGIRAACKPVDEKMVYTVTNKQFFRETELPDALSMPRTDIMKEALKADVIIAAPVAKSHSAAGVSLSMKGMMGLIYNRRVMHRTYPLQTSIVDLCTVLKADLVVIDGTRVLSTGGPRGPGKVLKADTVIASSDMVAADAYALSSFEFYGRRFKPKQVKHIREAHDRGLGRMDLENLKVKRVKV